jgi:hypothetical protein
MFQSGRNFNGKTQSIIIREARPETIQRRQNSCTSAKADRKIRLSTSFTFSLLYLKKTRAHVFDNLPIRMSLELLNRRNVRGAAYKSQYGEPLPYDFTIPTLQCIKSNLPEWP